MPNLFNFRKSRNGGEEGPEEEEADTDLETDRLLGQQRTDDHGFYDDKLVSKLFAKYCNFFKRKRPLVKIIVENLSKKHT